jgi:hypothetical protein
VAALRCCSGFSMRETCAAERDKGVCERRGSRRSGPVGTTCRLLPACLEAIIDGRRGEKGGYGMGCL